MQRHPCLVFWLLILCHVSKPAAARLRDHTLQLHSLCPQTGELIDKQQASLKKRRKKPAAAESGGGGGAAGGAGPDGAPAAKRPKVAKRKPQPGQSPAPVRFGTFDHQSSRVISWLFSSAGSQDSGISSKCAF